MTASPWSKRDLLGPQCGGGDGSLSASGLVAAKWPAILAFACWTKS